MSDPTYPRGALPRPVPERPVLERPVLERPVLERPLSWLHGEVRTPPFSKMARVEAGFLLRRLQDGEMLAMPHSRPMPSVGARCHELRILDADSNWRIVYRIDRDAIVLLEVFRKTTEQTPSRVIATCRRRLKAYDEA